MAEIFRIEIPVEVENKTDPGLGQASKNLNGFEKSVQRTRRQMEQMNQTKLQLIGTGLNKTMATLNSLRRTLFSITGRTWRIGVSVASAPFRMLNSISMSIMNLQMMMAGLFVGYTATKVFIDPLKMASDMERANIVFSTFLQSQQKGVAFFKQIQQFGAKTPFETTELQRYATQLLPVFDGNTKMVMRTLKAFGDTASLTGVGLENLDLSLYGFRQIASTDKLRMQDLRQVTDNLLLPMKAVQKELGLTSEQMADVGNQGIPAKKAIEAILRAMERPVKQGGFLGGMAQMMKTLSGQWSNFRDNIKMNFIKKWATGLESVALPALTGVNDWFDKNTDTVSKWGDRLHEAGRTVGTWIVNKVRGLKSALTDLTSSQEWQNATTFGQKMGVAWDFISDSFQGWWDKRKKDMIAGFGNVGGFLGGALKGGVMAALGIIDPSDKVSKDQSPFVTAGAQAGKAFFDKFMEQLDVKAIAKKLGQTAADVVVPSSDKSITQNLLGVGAGLLGGAFLYSKGKGLWETLSSPFKDLYNGAKKFKDAKWFGKPKSNPPVGAGPGIENPPVKSKLLGPDGKPIGGYQSRPPNLLTDSEKAARKAPIPKSGFGKSLLRSGKKAFGKLFLPLAIGMDALDIVTSKPGEERNRAIGGSIGGWGGAAAGAAGGAAIGSVVPIIGTAIGGVAGGIIGGFGGGMLGDWLGGKVSSGSDKKAIPVSIPKLPERTLSIEVKSEPTYNIETATDADEVMSIIRRNESQLANEMARQIADKLSEISANSP